MTTIPNLNIVIQQGDIARETHNIKNQVLDSTQNTVFERLAEEDRKRTVVAQTKEAEKVILNNEKAPGGNSRRQRKQSREKKKSVATEDGFDPDSTGRLLNTVA